MWKNIGIHFMPYVLSPWFIGIAFVIFVDKLSVTLLISSQTITASIFVKYLLFSQIHLLRLQPYFFGIFFMPNSFYTHIGSYMLYHWTCIYNHMKHNLPIFSTNLFLLPCETFTPFVSFFTHILIDRRWQHYNFVYIYLD